MFFLKTICQDKLTFSASGFALDHNGVQALHWSIQKTLLKLFFKNYLSRKYKFYCITYLTIEPVVVQNEKVVKQIYFYQIIVIFYKTIIKKKMYSDNHLQIYPSFSLRSLLNNSCIRYSSPLHVHEYFFVTAICDFKSYLSNHQHTLGKFSIEGGNAFFKTIEKCELC